MNKLISKLKSNNFKNPFFKFTVKNKYRRLNQPGLSRYSMDDTGIENSNYFVKTFYII